jgi:hypothetical protein
VAAVKKFTDWRWSELAAVPVSLESGIFDEFSSFSPLFATFGSPLGEL